MTSLLFLALSASMPNRAEAQAITTLHRFHSIISDGANAYWPLTRGTDGNFYGVAVNGGVYGGGMAFQLSPSGVYTSLHSFSQSEGYFPSVSLVQASDGSFYGATFQGGAYQSGVLFRMNVKGQVTPLHAFNPAFDGSAVRSLFLGKDGNLYGLSMYGGANGNGVAFKATTNGTFTPLNSFPGNIGGFPTLAFQGSDGSFYGGTNFFNASVFKMDTAGNVTVVHTLTSTEGTTINALLPGGSGSLIVLTTGGALGKGLLFRIDSQGVSTPLYTFTGGSEGYYPWTIVQTSDGSFYGITQVGGAFNGGTLFKLDTHYQVTVLHPLDPYQDGTGVLSSLTVAADQTLYGTIGQGGLCNVGTLFHIDQAGNYKPLRAFHFISDADHPQNGLQIDALGNFDGATQFGGRHGYGTIFRSNSAGLTVILHDFDGIDGNDPLNIVPSSDGSLYGITQSGGSTDHGVFFRVDSHGPFALLNETDLYYPQSPLIRSKDGLFYGSDLSTSAGPAGRLFKITSTGVLTPLHFLSYQDEGTQPNPLVQASDGNFYGTTQNAGGSNGVIFRMTSAGSFTVLHQFAFSSQNMPSEGANPRGALVEDGHGTLYGVTSYGGASQVGTIYKIDLQGNYTLLHSFTQAEGGNPLAGLTLGKDGFFYGTTSTYGTNNAGTIFRSDMNGNVTVLSALDPIATGYVSSGALVQGKDGRFYGEADYGGGLPAERFFGTLFRFDPSAPPGSASSRF